MILEYGYAVNALDDKGEDGHLPSHAITNVMIKLQTLDICGHRTGLAQGTDNRHLHSSAQVFCLKRFVILELVCCFQLRKSHSDQPIVLIGWYLGAVVACQVRHGCLLPQIFCIVQNVDFLEAVT